MSPNALHAPRSDEVLEARVLALHTEPLGEERAALVSMVRDRGHVRPERLGGGRMDAGDVASAAEPEPHGHVRSAAQPLRGAGSK